MFEESDVGGLVLRGDFLERDRGELDGVFGELLESGCEWGQDFLFVLELLVF